MGNGSRPSLSKQLNNRFGSGLTREQVNYRAGSYDMVAQQLPRGCPPGTHDKVVREAHWGHFFIIPGANGQSSPMQTLQTLT